MYTNYEELLLTGSSTIYPRITSFSTVRSGLCLKLNLPKDGTVLVDNQSITEIKGLKKSRAAKIKKRKSVAESRASKAIAFKSDIKIRFGLQDSASINEPAIKVTRETPKVKLCARKPNEAKQEDHHQIAMFQRLTLRCGDWKQLLRPELKQMHDIPSLRTHNSSEKTYVNFAIYIGKYFQFYRSIVSMSRMAFNKFLLADIDKIESWDSFSQRLRQVVEEAVNFTINDLKKYCMDPLFNSAGIRQVLVSELGSYKSLCLTGIVRVLEQDFYDHLVALFPQCSTKCSGKIAGLLVSLILGSSSKDHENDEDLDDSEEKAEDNNSPWFYRVLAQLCPVTVEDKAMVSWFLEEKGTKQDLVINFVPESLRHLVANGKRQFQQNIRGDNYLLVLKYFHKYNIKKERVVQRIGLQPSTVASFTLVNTYILAQLICGYRCYLNAAGVDTKGVFRFLETEDNSQDSVAVAGANNYAFKVPNDLLKSEWRKHSGKSKRTKVIFDSYIARIKFSYQY